MKKGDLSINIIVVAAIAMLILVIMSVLIFRTGSGLTDSTMCENLGGGGAAQCVDRNQGCSSLTDGFYVPHPGGQCPSQGGQDQICCLRQGSAN